MAELRPPPMQADTSSFNTRLRLVEEKCTNLNRKIEFLEGNLVATTKKFNEAIHHMDADLLEAKRNLDSFKQKIELIIRELKLTAGKDELTSVQRYLDLWDLTRFVSREELDKLIEEKLRNLPAHHEVAHIHHVQKDL